MATDNDTKGQFDYIKQLPIITLLVLLFGTTKIFTYYYYFNLNIFPLLEITELLPQTIFDLFISSFAIGAAVGTSLYFSIPFNRKEKPRSAIYVPKIFHTETFVRYTWLQLIKKGWVYLLPVLLLTSVTVNQYLTIIKGNSNVYKDFHMNEYSFYIELVVVITFIVYMLFIPTGVRKKSTQLIFCVAVVLFVLGFFEGNVKYNKVVVDRKQNRFSAVIGGYTIQSNPNFYFIGMTKNYVLFYNSKIKLVTIYPVSLVSKLEIAEP